ncbi:MAG: hypothetical protein RSA22_05545 [Acinetobacter sp.]
MQKTHAKVEDCLSLDSRSMAKAAVFENGKQGRWIWSNTSTGEETATIGYQYHNSQLKLSYAVNGQPYNYGINVETTPCNYGGVRYWFNCTDCHKRVAKLYLRSSFFLCRKCQKLNYATQQENKLDSTRRVMCRIRHKLDWKYDNAWMKSYYKIKPKGMHQTTFDKMVVRHDQLEHKTNRYLMTSFRSLSKRYGFEDKLNNLA